MPTKNKKYRNDMYYTIGLLFSEERNGIFSHLPFSSPVTRDEKEAQSLFDYYIRTYTDNWRGNELIYDKPCERDYQCMIREAMVKCNEAAHMHGYYVIELNVYSFNPHK